MQAAEATEARETQLADLLVARWRRRVGVGLHAAGCPGQGEQVHWPLASGADPDAPTFEGKTPLRGAMETGQ